MNSNFFSVLFFTYFMFAKCDNLTYGYKCLFKNLFTTTCLHRVCCVSELVFRHHMNENKRSYENKISNWNRMLERHLYWNLRNCDIWIWSTVKIKVLYVGCRAFQNSFCLFTRKSVNKNWRKKERRKRTVETMKLYDLNITMFYCF